MRPSHYAQLCAIARREGRDANAAEDMVQDAMLAAVLAGRTDFDRPETARWLVGTVRNKARMAARGAARQRRRDGQWLDAALPVAAPAPDTELGNFIATLPASLRVVAALVLSGHRRREIAYLLKLSDMALRQRIVALKRRIVQAGLVMPGDLPGLSLDLAYGRIRDALLPQLVRNGGIFASHDPDGHLFIVSRSQKPEARQLEAQPPRRAP